MEIVEGVVQAATANIQAVYHKMDDMVLGHDERRATSMYSARRPGAWDGRLDCSAPAPAILLRAKKSEVLLTAQISE